MSPSPQQDITAAIINYGSRQDSAELTRKLESQVQNIIVVDNSNDISSSDPAFAHAEIITPMENIGFGAAANLAARQIKTRWLLVLNPDVRLKRNCLKHLLDASVQMNAPLCGPRFYWDDACTFQLPPALGHPLWLLSDRHIPDSNLAETTDVSELAMARHKRFWSESTPFSEPVLSGACLLFDNDWFKLNKVPLFDEAFFLYYEDTDLCGRMLHKGMMPVCAPQASAVHYWNQSSEPPAGKAALMQASEKIFMQKYYPNGAPPLPRREHRPSITDLGQSRIPPALLLPGTTSHLDIGTQDDFIVFARTAVTQPSFSFSKNLEKRLRPGTYFFRAVDQSDKGLQYWCWQKTE